MINLSLTTDKLELTTDSAATLDVHASWADYASGSVTPGKTNTAFSSPSTADIVPVPGASTVRNVKKLNIRNKDAALSVTVTVKYNQNGTVFELFKTILSPGDVLVYTEQLDFYVITGTAKLNAMLVVTNDYVNATTSFTDITGLTIGLKSGKKYVFMAELIHINDSTTTGSQFGYNIGAAPTVSIVGTIDTVTPSVTASVHSGGVITARDTAITAQTTGAATQRLAHIAGYIQPSADGTFAMRGKSEVAVAAGLTVKAGSFLHIRETDN